MAYYGGGNCMIPPVGYYPGGCHPTPPTISGSRIVRVSVPGIQGPAGEVGYSCRFCQKLEAHQTVALENLRPALDVKVGDQVVNGTGEIFIISAVSQTTFSVGSVVGTLGVQIDDTVVSAKTVWSSYKLDERLGDPTDFVKIFEEAVLPAAK